MYIKKNYGFWLTVRWSRKPLIYGALYAAVVVVTRYLIKQQWGYDMSLPWQPISVVGIAVAFYLGFKNNVSYERTWEARKIWGSIVNNSRTFTAALLSFVEGEGKETKIRRIIYRHIAWLITLDYQLRLAKEWEHDEIRLVSNKHTHKTDAYYIELAQKITKYLDNDELAQYLTKSNIATHLMKRQSLELQKLYNDKCFNSFRHMQLFECIKSFYEDQGKSERIKNFPFPRQYASTALWQTLIFALLVPFGLLSVFAETVHDIHLIVIPFSALITWVFFLMERIGDYSENPFEGSFNDVPITTISRDIEIDIRQMIDDDDIPSPIQSENGFLM